MAVVRGTGEDAQPLREAAAVGGGSTARHRAVTPRLRLAVAPVLIVAVGVRVGIGVGVIRAIGSLSGFLSSLSRLLSTAAAACMLSALSAVSTPIATAAVGSRMWELAAERH